MRFIRKHGRIIPINDDRAKGAAMIGAGAAVAAASGKIASRMTHESAKMENAARATVKAAISERVKLRSMGPLFQSAADSKYKTIARDAMKTATRSKGLFKAGFKVRHAGFLVGSALIGAGVHKLSSKEDDPEAQAATAAGVAAATHFAIRSSYLKGVGMSRFKAAGHALRDVLKGMRKIRA